MLTQCRLNDAVFVNEVSFGGHKWQISLDLYFCRIIEHALSLSSVCDVIAAVNYVKCIRQMATYFSIINTINIRSGIR